MRKDEDKLREALTDYFNDGDKVLLKTVENALIVVIEEAKHSAPCCDLNDQ